MTILKSLTGFLGRALLSIIFISSAAFKLFDWHATLQFFSHGMTDWLALNVGSSALQQMLEWGIANASFLLAAGIAFELVGGLLVFFGLWVRFGALLLFLFMIPTTLIFHHFWQMQGADRTLQMTMFMKNLSISGGLLTLIAYGKGCKCERQDDHSPKAY